MAKFYGKVGYVETVETRPGVFTQSVTERTYCGDLVRNSRKWQTSGNVNDDVNVNNEISIVADPFAYDHFAFIRYVEYMGVLWNVTAVEVQRPRLILSVGGVYNGQQPCLAARVSSFMQERIFSTSRIGETLVSLHRL